MDLDLNREPLDASSPAPGDASSPVPGCPPLSRADASALLHGPLLRADAAISSASCVSSSRRISNVLPCWSRSFLFPHMRLASSAASASASFTTACPCASAKLRRYFVIHSFVTAPLGGLDDILPHKRNAWLMQPESHRKLEQIRLRVCVYVCMCVCEYVSERASERVS